MANLEVILKISVAVFMLGNLLDMGLRVDLSRALVGLKQTRFVGAILLWGFVALPALAWLLARVLPIENEHATGLVLLGMAPVAPFLPPMVERARGNLDLAAAVLLVASIGIVIYMPLAVPFLVPGLDTSAAAIARPLLLFLLLPLALGIAIQRAAPGLAARLHPVVKAATGADTLLMLALCVVVYGKGFLTLAGSWVIGAQLVFFAAATLLPWLIGPGLGSDERVVLSLSMATRNLGSAFAPLFALPMPERQAIVTVALGVLMQAGFSYAAATWFAARAPERSVRP